MSSTFQGHNTSSGRWNRLRPVNSDILEVIGLPSKGDQKLLSYKTQEEFYTRIVERYMAFCSAAGQSDELIRRLARVDQAASAWATTEGEGSLSQRHQGSDNNNILSGGGGGGGGDLEDTDVKKRRNSCSSDGSDKKGTERIRSNSSNSSSEQADISILLMAMRKLREGIMASNRVDNFSIQAYIFSIRLSILVKHVDSYYPAILHLLQKMHPVQALARREIHEFAGYLILDLACRQEKLNQAYSIRSQYQVRDIKLDAILRSLCHDNFILFWRVKRSVDGHRVKLIEFAEETVRRQTLKCLARSYLKIDLPSLESWTQATWPTLTTDLGVGWYLDAGKVIIRKEKRGLLPQHPS